MSRLDSEKHLWLVLMMRSPLIRNFIIRLIASFFWFLNTGKVTEKRLRCYLKSPFLSPYSLKYPLFAQKKSITFGVLAEKAYLCTRKSNAEVAQSIEH